MGERNTISTGLHVLKIISILNTPFDFVPCFDQALRNVIIAIPGRPAKERSEDAVSGRHYSC
jgi:hypothetical protein